MGNTRQKIIVILGPTASGKSEVAIKLAKKFNGEIISADSRQVYRGMDIGTGKIPGRVTLNLKPVTYLSEGISHYSIDIVSPKTEYNAAKFKKDANYIIRHVLRKGKLPIICGGTGFWIKAIIDNVDFPEVKPDEKLRRKLNNKNANKLFEMLQKLDPERARNIDAKNKVRLIRAIEICKKLGKVPKINSQRKNYDFFQIGIEVSKKNLHENIKKRLGKRFKQGMIKEVEKLHSSGISWKKIQSFGLGYCWIPLYLQNKIPREELFEKIYQAEKNYAKRQMTWFKKDRRIKWMKNYKEIERKTKNFINKMREMEISTSP
jgi:tRNA dimethylallyltransferase